MKYRQPIIVLSLLLFLVAVALTGFLLYQRNQTGLPLIVSGGNSGLNINPSLPVIEEDKVDENINITIDEEGLNQEFVIDVSEVPESTIEEVDSVDPSAILEEVTPLKRELQNTREYKIRSGDTVSGITVKEWGNVVLWPDLYVNNQWIYDDPDLILPGEIVTVFDKLGMGRSELSAEEVKLLSEAYIKVYTLYAQLGSKRNASKWYTLGLALRVEPRFFEIYADRIDPRDIEMVRSLNQQANALR
ncbi:hypothetical protein PVA44_04260 [Entomospira nematocerorum]|uniref:LysM domain-containing protein n=1 Tax=Entomospira nematocerorum TaxID=2719987 RepID=A0A968GGL4_9SPIO|nr:hypothetical protein [Entomospira nematocera]NIZ46761.1 hypothetical protein [Entomospira nematocera]WDI33442.1 hypothetical protein PVA44_04260 [Entomospira nematocera]